MAKAAPTAVKKKSKNDDDVEVYPDEEQGILPDETSDERRIKMKAGQEDEDIYTKEGEELLGDDDEIEPWEEGFMQGASGAGQLGKDALTGKPLMGGDEVIEMELEGRMYRFANRENADKFRQKKMMEKKKGK